jgi:hypothetical protein
MNERMNELARQSGIGFLSSVPPDMLDKFAELIVQECADVCQSFGESGDGYTCSYEILEHFGVE